MPDLASWLGEKILITVATALIALAGEIQLGPSGPGKHLASPDGSKVLYEVPYHEGANNSRELWLEDERTHKRTKLLDIRRTGSAEWSPDGAVFYVNDDWVSDQEDAYIYDSATLARLKIGDLIQARDPASRPFALGHRYYQITRWIAPNEVVVRFFGHTDQPPVRNFEFRYRVSRAGAVKKLSERVTPVKKLVPTGAAR